MALQQNIDHARPEHFTEVLTRTADELARLRKWHADGTLPLLRLPEKRDDVATILGYASLLRDGTSDVVFLGTGGSSLGGQTVAQLAGQAHELAHRLRGDALGLAQLVAQLGRSLLGGGLQAQQHARECLVGLVVKVACQPRALAASHPAESHSSGRR